MAPIVHTCLRLLYDHIHYSGNSKPTIIEIERELAISLLRTHFRHCLIIGRDLVRLLVCIGTKYEQFNSFWQDLVKEPHKLEPNFKGLEQLMNTKTPRRMVQGRVPAQLEQKIHWMLHHLPNNQYRIHLAWLDQYYFNVSSSLAGQSLRADLIRYICTFIHPTNEILNAPVLQRWQLIIHLMAGVSTCPPVLMQCRLALFIDFLFFNPKNASIMDIEPGMLVLYHGRKIDPRLPSQLFEFLCKLAQSFHAPFVGSIIHNIKFAFKFCEEKRMIPKISKIIDTLNPAVQKMVQEVFNFSNTSVPIEETTTPLPVSSPASPAQTNMEDVPEVKQLPVKLEALDSGIASEKSEEKSEKSEDKIDRMFANIDPQVAHLMDIMSTVSSYDESEAVDLREYDEYLAKLPPLLVEIVESINESKNDSKALNTNIEDLINRWSVNKEAQDDADVLATCLCLSLKEYFFKQLPVKPDKKNEKNKKEVLSNPIIFIVDNLSNQALEAHDGADNEFLQNLLLLFLAIYKLRKQTGVLFLYYISFQQNSKIWYLYDKLLQLGDFIVQDVIQQDLRRLGERFPDVFIKILIPLYRSRCFQKILFENTKIFQTVVQILQSVFDLKLIIFGSLKF